MRTFGSNRFLTTLVIFLILQTFVSGAAFAQLLTTAHFPLNEGQSWEYLENGTVTVTKDVLLGLEDVNGAATFVLETVGGEVGFGQERYTNDTLGLRFHRASDAGGAGTFVPPLVILEEEIVVGQTINSSGSVVVAPGFMFPYTGATTVVGPATVTVPAGTFDTIVVETTITINGNPTTDRLYLANGVGVVRAEANIFAPGGISELVAVPEPTFLLSVSSSAAFLCLVARRHKGAINRHGFVASSLPGTGVDGFTA